MSVIDMDGLDGELHVRISAVDELLETLRTAVGGGTVLSVEEIVDLLMEQSCELMERPGDVACELFNSCKSMAYGLAILIQRMIFR